MRCRLPTPSLGRGHFFGIPLGRGHFFDLPFERGDLFGEGVMLIPFERRDFVGEGLMLVPFERGDFVGELLRVPFQRGEFVGEGLMRRLMKYSDGCVRNCFRDAFRVHFTGGKGRSER